MAIARDRTFWFANVERTQQDKTRFVTIAPSDVAAVNASLDATGYRGPRIATGPFSTGYHTTNLFGRLDHQATPGTRLTLRYTFYDVASPNARTAGGLSDVSRGTDLDNRDQTAAGSVLSLFSDRVINEARGQYTRSRLDAPVNDPVGPAVTISGVATFGTSTAAPTVRDLDVFQAADTLTVQWGGHLLKTGVDLLFNRVTITFPGGVQGSYTFSSLANFQRGTYVQFQQAFGIPSLSQSNPNAGFFVQDEWRAWPRVTINAGLRYDLQWLPDPIRLDRDNISPRAGIAWAPGDGRTVVRASGGLRSRSAARDVQRAAARRRQLQSRRAVVRTNGRPAVSERAAFVSAGNRDGDYEHRSRDPERFQPAVRRAGRTRARGDRLATAGYSYLRGGGIIMSRNINVPTLTAAQAALLGVPNLGRPNPSFANISQYQSIGDSWFNGLTVSLATRTTSWGSARVSYTLSRALDDAGDAFFSSPQDSFNVLGDKGPSDNDQRHRLVVSGTAGGSEKPGTVRRMPGGLQLGYVFSYATGLPFNVQTGDDRNNDTTANHRPPGVGRNSARLPHTSTFDLRVSRSFALGGAHRLLAMVEAFNLFNHVNVLNVNNTFGTGTTPRATFGRPTLAGDPRQIHVAIRWSFQ